jgi:DNA polymerase-3 subunit epsilon
MIDGKTYLTPTPSYDTFLIFDTETGGFPNKKLALTDPAQPPTVQIGAILCNRERVLGELNMILAVGNRSINPHAAKVHGMDADFCNRYGVPPGEALLSFITLADKADVLVCHKFAFDVQMLEMLYATYTPTALEEFKAKPNYCTMLGTTDYCALPNKWGKNKWPKLEELHTKLFGQSFDGAHDAMADVRATVRCFMHKDIFPY